MDAVYHDILKLNFPSRTGRC